MGSLFDSANYPTAEPDEFIVGDRWAWKRTDLGVDYAPNSFTLSYTARLQGTGATTFSVTCTGSGTDYLAEVAASTTAMYTAGTYHWDAYLTRDSDSERITIGAGIWDILPNRAVSEADPRSHAQKVLDSIQALIEGRTADVVAYTIAGRSVQKMSPEELWQWRARYKAEVEGEQAALQTALGKPSRYSILIRMD